MRFTGCRFRADEQSLAGISGSDATAGKGKREKPAKAGEIAEFTFDSLIADYCGNAGRSLQEFYYASYREVYAILKGHRASIRAQEVNDWERTRLQTLLLLQVKMKKGVKLKPTDILKLPWDAETPEKKTPDVQAKKAIWDKWDSEIAAQYGTSLEEVQKLQNGE